MDQRVSELLSLAVQQSMLRIAGAYTNPRSWGVYEVDPAQPVATKRFRIGNHPVRQHELEREFGTVRRIALFTSRTLAEQLSAILNTKRAER